MQTAQKTGTFYLGRTLSPVAKQQLFYDSKDLTTHAVCVGMTGSGKTGLGIVILEEAALNKIPAIIIDPKGDLGNLLLTFPELSPQEFQPWVDEAEAERQGMSVAAYAESIAKTWKEGLAAWGEDAERIQKLKSMVEMDIYTPANEAGIPLSILSSFAAPSKETIQDAGAMRERVLTTVSSLLGLIGIQADPIKSREHILLSAIIDAAWREGSDLDLAQLIQRVQKPPFDKIGVMDLDTFYPAKERMALANNLNSLLASPGFQAWMQGTPLDIQQLLYTAEGQPKLSIISIAHLTDVERMFFVTLLLNQLLAWMRRQPGTSNLRAILYMDEIFGFFPPTAAPPSKLPMLTLLKQARAFGLGIVLATQNPVDLDYKGLSNCGTWFIGKLQTERDKARVVDGLVTASNGEIDSKALDKLLASVGKRIFIMRSIHEKDPIVFETRWTMSYLRGPLTLSQINILMHKKIKQAAPYQAPKEKKETAAVKSIVPPGISELYVKRPEMTSPAHYSPRVAVFAKVHYIDKKNNIDTWEEVNLVASADDAGNTVLWDDAEQVPALKQWLEKEPLANSTFENVPAGLLKEKNYPLFTKSLALALYQNQALSILSYPELDLYSKEGESESDFRARVSQALQEKTAEQIKKLRDSYVPKMATLTERLRRYQGKLEQKQQKAWVQKIQTFISFLVTIVSSFFGKRITKGTITQAGTSMRGVGRVTRDSQEVTQAEEDAQTIQQQLDDLQAQLKAEEVQITSNADPSRLKLETVEIKPRKMDISVERIALVWWPK